MSALFGATNFHVLATCIHADRWQADPKFKQKIHTAKSLLSLPRCLEARGR